MKNLLSIKTSDHKIEIDDLKEAAFEISRCLINTFGLPFSEKVIPAPGKQKERTKLTGVITPNHTLFCKWLAEIGKKRFPDSLFIRVGGEPSLIRGILFDAVVGGYEESSVDRELVAEALSYVRKEVKDGQ